jgi:hypothetical protein
MDAAKLQYLLDCKAIRDLRCTYARGLDRRDFDLAVSPYAEDVHFKAPDTEYRSRSAIKDAVSRLALYRATMHTMLNHLVEVNGDRAKSETYCVAYHYYDIDGVQQQYVMGIRYEDQLRRRGDGWEIFECRANFDFMTGQSRLFANRNAAEKRAANTQAQPTRS